VASLAFRSDERQPENADAHSNAGLVATFTRIENEWAQARKDEGRESARPVAGR